jgi:ElaB/YqjD/DUF883 family membrane-anchored ribosome-binding protein
MTELTTEPAQSSGSTTEQAKERVSEGAQQLQEKASDAKTQTREKLRGQIDTRSTQTGEQMTGTASALRQTAQRLRGDGQEPQAKVLDQIADRADQFGRYLTQTDGERLLHDVERMARQRPWLVAAGGTILGFMAARFTKASSSRRYEAGGDGIPALPPPAQTGREGGDRGDL